MEASMKSWLCDELWEYSVDISEENVRYILAMKHDQDVKDYLMDLIGDDKFCDTEFITRILQQIKSCRESLCSSNAYDYSINLKKKSNGSKKGKNSAHTHLSPGSQKLENRDTKIPKSQVASAKKKSKFVSLYGESGNPEVVILKGRHRCDCQATRHCLINNCLSCGRVVCEQEGSGPCLFCSTLVCTNEEYRILQEDSVESESLHAYLNTVRGYDPDHRVQSSGNTDVNLAKAVAYKNRLLEYNKTSAKRTHIIDDESDYFSTGSRWLSPEDRDKLERREAELRERQRTRRHKSNVTLDFEGCKVTEDREDLSGLLYNEEDQVLKEVYKTSSPVTAAYAERNTRSNGSFMSPTYITPTDNTSDVTNTINGINKRDERKMNLRLQDKELQEMSDSGMCLSLHQPWASLLIAGIKRYECRSWYTAHRGRLWIASASKLLPDKDSIVESYRVLCPDLKDNFPTSYPVSSLLGCVDIIDCLCSEDFTIKYPDHEVDSSYVFICDNPCSLSLTFPIKGKHKIYKLERHVHEAAKKSLVLKN